MMAHHCFIQLLPLLTWVFLLQPTQQLQSSQTQVLLQLRKHLEYPAQLEMWNLYHATDLCYMQPSKLVNISCQDNSVTELKIMGVDYQSLSAGFSMDSFVATLARLNSLRVLSLVSLGIWGPLPDKIHRLASLEYLDLSSNHLFGSVPPKISTMVKLQTLILDHNFFNSTVPSSFDSLSNLTVLSLRNNQLHGPMQSLEALTNLQVVDLSLNNFVSDLPSLPTGLLMAILSNNSFSGKIPMEYSQLNQLQHLDLSFNELIGTTPASLFALDNIRSLNLASNMLSGTLPDSLRCGGKLQFVDISSNMLIGGLPSCLVTGSDDKRLVLKLGGNCFSSSLYHQHLESACTQQVPLAVERKQSGGRRNLGVLVGFVAGIVAVVALLAFGFVFVYRRYLSRDAENLLREDPVQHLSSARFVSQASKVGSQGLPECRSFAVEELKKATNNFDNAALLGQGYYGKLYKGRLEDGSQVAIRCLPTSNKYTTRNLKLRLDLLAKLRHPNLVCLLGHCIDNGGQDEYRVDQVFLVYEHISNGNFQTQVFGNSMNWAERLAALTGVAKALHFLHTGVIPGFFNNRLKTHNILVNEHGMVKLSDYGLSIVSDENRNSADSEGLGSWQNSKVEDDIHGFGFILLESLVGSPVREERDEFLTAKLASCSSRAKLINPKVMETASQESLTTVISITEKCISPESAASRPSLEDILWNLQYAGQIQAASDEQSVVVVAQR
ncbi:Probable inactive leucine-rich repeat receptor-like protein kinase At3g03770 [Linum grandiflorum]